MCMLSFMQAITRSYHATTCQANRGTGTTSVIGLPKRGYLYPCHCGLHYEHATMHSTATAFKCQSSRRQQQNIALVNIILSQGGLGLSTSEREHHAGKQYATVSLLIGAARVSLAEPAASNLGELAGCQRAAWRLRHRVRRRRQGRAPLCCSQPGVPGPE